MTNIQKYVKFLQIHPPFNEMPVDLVEKTASAIQVHHYGAGQTIFRKDEEAMTFYIIHTGMVREVLRGNNEEETTISVLKSGDPFGAISILTGQRRKLDAVVEEDVELYVIYKQDMDRLLSEYPAMNMYFNRTLSEKLDMFFEHFNREKIRIVDKEKLSHEKEKKLSLINEITKLLSIAEDIELKLFPVVDLLKKRMNADACSLFIIDNLSDRLILEASSGLELPEGKTIAMRGNEGITGWVVNNREAVSLENAESDPRVKFISEIHEERFKSLLSIPLIAGEETLGAINFQTIEPRKYNYEEIRGMIIAGGQIAMVLYNAMLKKRLDVDIDTLETEKGAVAGEFVGKSSSIKRINKFVAKVADSKKSVLLEGEEGTGKELLARFIHSSSRRKNGPFVEGDCRFFLKESWGDELFGMEEGTGASKIIRRGLVEKADKGILYLKNVEKLNSACQVKIFNFLHSGLYNRVGSKIQHRANVRIICTAIADVKTMVFSGSFNKNSYESLNGFGFKTESLRKMRRDIPEFCGYLLKRIGRQTHKKGLSVSESAEKKLQSYHWPGNVAELENVLNGAAILTSGNIIEADHLFFPSRAPGDKPVYNLFLHSRISNLLKGKVFPDIFGKIGLIIFCLSISSMLFFPGENFLNSLFWSVGWFFIFSSTFLIGRVFCAVCPFMITGEIVQNWKSYKMTRSGTISQHGENLSMFFIFVIFWMEGSFGLQEKPFYTALLLLSITLGAVICAVVFERRVWCRYLCPMGRLLGISSLTSIFSLDADKHVCMYRCGTHECYTGKETEPGCQLFLHPYAIESQQDCVLCMQCHKNCPYGSVKLNLQFPGTGIVAAASPSLALALTSTALVGILPVERGALLAPANDFFNKIVNGLGIDVILLYTAIFLGAAALPSLLLLLMERLLGGHDFKKSVYRLTRFGYSLLPLALLGHIAFYGKKTIEWLEAIISRTGVAQIDFFSANLVFYGIYAIIILLGAAGTIHTFIRIHRSDPPALTTGRKLMVGYTALIGFYTILYLLAVL
tara:strand:+ start:54582 stop:57656 length:3075 start_codon:yes stop_codon:yes gene_type:complete